MKLKLTKKFYVAGLAVGVVPMLLEGALVQQLQAEGAGEVLGMKLLAHCSDTLAHDRLLAAGTERAAGSVVVDLTVGLTLVIKVVPTGKRNLTNLQHE